MARQFNNQKVIIDDVVITVGVHKAEDGSQSIKLRLPQGDWVLSQLFRATDAGLKEGKHAVAVFDMDPEPEPNANA